MSDSAPTDVKSIEEKSQVCPLCNGSGIYNVKRIGKDGEVLGVYPVRCENGCVNLNPMRGRC